jgi:hypothetical protein
MPEQLDLMPGPWRAYVEIVRPTAVLRFNRPRLRQDPRLLDDLRETSVTGRALAFRAAEFKWQVDDPMMGLLYREGYQLHKRRLPDGRYAVWVVRDRVRCDVCQTEFDVVDYVTARQGKARLRRRDPCPSPGCTGRVRARRRVQ